MLRTQTEHLLTLHDARTAHIHQFDEDVKRAAKGNAVVKQLTTIPGVGLFSALFVQAEPGSITRLRSSHEVAAYAGLVRTTRSSGGKTAYGGLGKANNRWRKWSLVEIVVTLKLAPGPVGTYYRHLLRSKGKPKAQAAARTLCWYLFWMLKNEWTYEEWLRQHMGTERSEVRPMQRMGTMA